MRGGLSKAFFLLVFGAALCLASSILTYYVSPPAYAQKRKARKKRPARQPQPKDDRVYLVHADVLHFDQYKNPDATILNGKVHFTHVGARLYCDSAYFYEASNSFEAFGHVRMYQGDTLSLVSDYAYYDGNEQMARARYNVVLKNRKTTLYTDSLDFDRLYDNAYFFEGGKMVDGGTTLISDWGEYNTKTKLAVFNFDVKMRNKDMYLTTDTLYYDTRTSTAQIVGPTDITSGKSHIYSERGYYDTRNDRSQLLDRSVLTNQGKLLIGDSIWHDEKTGISKAFYNVVYTDTVNNNMLTGNYGEYDDLTGYAMCTDSAMVADFSQRDTLFMHADTFKIYTFNINTDSVYRKIHAYNKVRAYRRDVQAVCDSLVYNSLDSCMTMYRDPIVWNMRQQLVGEEIQVFMKDSVVDHAHVINQAFSIEELPDRENYNQVSSKEMFAFFKEGKIHEARAKDNVLIIYYPEDSADSSLIGLNYTETSELRMFMEEGKMKKIWMPKAEGTLYPMSQIPPDKKRLNGFMWFDYVRPLSKEDIFVWRGKKPGTEMKPQATGRRKKNNNAVTP
jgi:lipopolysaccharide export system protein LptA